MPRNGAGGVGVPAVENVARSYRVGGFGYRAAVRHRLLKCCARASTIERDVADVAPPAGVERGILRYRALAEMPAVGGKRIRCYIPAVEGMACFGRIGWAHRRVALRHRLRVDASFGTGDKRYGTGWPHQFYPPGVERDVAVNKVGGKVPEACELRIFVPAGKGGVRVDRIFRSCHGIAQRHHLGIYGATRAGGKSYGKDGHCVFNPPCVQGNASGNPVGGEVPGGS